MQTSRKRGRPVAVDRRHVSAVALRLFEAHGIEQVTMDAVADAASVSRRTLFRLFPSKADLVWEGLGEVMLATRERISAFGTQRLTLGELVDALVVPAFQLMEDPQWESLARRRLRLIASSPELLNHAVLRAAQSLMAEIITTNVGDLEAPSELVATSVVSVAFATVLWWAAQDSTDDKVMKPVEALRAAFASVARVRGTAIGRGAE